MFVSQPISRPIYYSASPSGASATPAPVARGPQRKRGSHYFFVSRVVVIGGGVIGCAVAERLSLQRHQVTLLERDQLGCRASGAAAGELSPYSNSAAVRKSAVKSLEMFPEVVARIEKDGAMGVEYHLQPALLPAFDEEEAGRIKASKGRWLDGKACRDLAPSLTPMQSARCYGTTGR